jgi:hypothetical protein
MKTYPVSPASCIAAGAVASTFFLAAAPAAHATALLFDDGVCGGTGGAAQCTVTNGIVTATAYQITEISPVAGNTGWANFQSAFTSWNDDVFGGDGVWTLDTGTLSTEASFTVTTYRALVGQCPNGPCGGAEIRVAFNNAGDAPYPISNVISIGPTNAVWSQSVLTNMKLAGSQPGNPYIDSANGANGVLGPPAYPGQYDGINSITPASGFYDLSVRYPNATWLGDAFISTVDYTHDILTVYDGIEWGYTVVPGPVVGAGIPGLVFAFGGVLVYWRRRQQAKSAEPYSQLPKQLPIWSNRLFVIVPALVAGIDVFVYRASASEPWISRYKPGYESRDLGQPNGNPLKRSVSEV